MMPVPTATVAALEVTTTVVDAFVVVCVADADWLGSRVDVPEKIARIVLVPTVRKVVVEQVAVPPLTAMATQPVTGAPFDVKLTVPADPVGLTTAVSTTALPLVCEVGDEEMVVVVVVVAVSGVMVTVPLPLCPAPRNEPERFDGE
jgi:hypothetical protein